MPEILVNLTVKTAAWLTAGEAAAAGVASGPVLTLMQGAMKAMLVKKLKWAAVFVAAALVAGGGGLWLRQPAAAESPNRTKEADPVLSVRPVDPRTVARTEETNRPLGSWEKNLGPNHFTLTIEADRIHGTYTETDQDQKISCMVDADYSVTKDSVLYGVITGVEVEGTEKEVAQAPIGATRNLDSPFSFHFRVDGDVLTLKDVKFGDPPTNGKDYEPAILQGRWKKKSETSHDTPR